MALLYRLEGSFALLSLLGSFLIILSALFVRQLRQHPANYVVFMSICDFIFALKFAVTAVAPDSESLQDDDLYCLIQAIWTQFFGLASISWNGVISINLILNLRRPFVDTSKFDKIWHLLVWTYAAGATGFMLGFDKWGPSGDGTCWVEDDFYYFRLSFFIPLVMSFALGILAFIIGVMATRYIAADRYAEARRRMVFRMFFYVAIFIACWSGPLAHRLAQYYGEQSEVLQYADGIGVSVQGFANAMVWLSNPSFFKSFKRNILMRFDIFKFFFRSEESRVPLLGQEWNAYLHDDSSDFQNWDAVMRLNIITFLLYAMQESCETAKHVFGKPLNESDFKDSVTIKRLMLPRADRFDQFKFVDYSPLPFQKLRAQAGISPEDYMESVAPETFLESLNNQKFSEGRSGSFFCFSPDRSIIIKTIPKEEAKILRRILPIYYQYVKANPETRIMRVYGCHAIKMWYGDVIYVMVMANAFHTRNKIHERYDLKGSWVNREVGKAHLEDPSRLGMDMDLKRAGRKIFVSSERRASLLRQITQDAQFLWSLDIMDYSILVGFHFCSNDGSDGEDGEDWDADEKKEEIDALLKAKLNPSELLESQREPSINTSSEECHSIKRFPSAEYSVHSKGKEKGMNDSRDISEDVSSAHFRHSLQGLDPGILSFDCQEIYYLAIIDTLQLYDWNKKLERFWKVRIVHKSTDGVSVQPPDVYRDRFIKCAEQLIISSRSGEEV